MYRIYGDRVIKFSIGSLLGVFFGFLCYWGFTVLSGVWLTLILALMGVFVALGGTFRGLDFCRGNTLYVRIFGSMLTSIGVLCSEYVVIRQVFISEGQITASDVTLFPRSFHMFITLLHTTTWWQTLLALLLAVLSYNLLLKDRLI